MLDFYGMDGEPLSMGEWSKMFTSDPDYKRVDQTTLPNGLWVSTVLLGTDHSWGGGVPIIFETMVFPSSSNFSEMDMDRYATKEQAQAGHDAMVAQWRDWTPEEGRTED